MRLGKTLKNRKGKPETLLRAAYFLSSATLPPRRSPRALSRSSNYTIKLFLRESYVRPSVIVHKSKKYIFYTFRQFFSLAPFNEATFVHFSGQEMPLISRLKNSCFSFSAINAVRYENISKKIAGKRFSLG